MQSSRRGNDSTAMIVIMNRGAGGPDDPQARIVELFAALGETPRIVHPEGDEDIASIAREAADGSEKVIVAAGGDGTINAVAAELAGTDKILGVLPIGTLNHFAKDLGIPLDLETAVRTIKEGEVAAVDAGEVNGRIFINNSSLGIYPQIVSRREEQQERLARGNGRRFFGRRSRLSGGSPFSICGSPSKVARSRGRPRSFLWATTNTRSQGSNSVPAPVSTRAG